MNIQKEGNNIIYSPPFAMHALCSFFLRRKNATKAWKLNPASIVCSFIYTTSYFPHKLYETKIKHSHVHCQWLNKLPFSVSDVCFVWRRGTPARGDNFISKLWPQMRERQLDRVRRMSTFHGTNGMSVKHQYTDAFSPERPEMLSGDAALLFQAYSGCTGNILSFYPSTSPRSISDPLTINDFLLLPKFASLGCPSFPRSFLHAGLLKFLMQPSCCCLVLSLRRSQEFPILILLSISSNIGDCTKMIKVVRGGCFLYLM